jgi:hypothetical protein
MAVRRVAPPELQPKDFSFTVEVAILGSLDIVFGEVDR